MLFSIIVWKTVNVAGLTIISQKACKAYLQGQLLIGIWELGWVPPLLNEKSGSLCLNCLCKQYDLSWTPAFFLRVWNLLCARQRVFTWQAPDKDPGCWISNELPWWTTFHMCCHSCWLAEDPWKLVPRCPWTIIHAPSPFADCALYPLASNKS